MNDIVKPTSTRRLITPAIKKLILEKTPEQFVRTRPGRGGKQLSYVETGYIVKRLNEVFNYLWDFEVLEDKIGNDQIYVKGKLTAHLTPELSISKTQYGGKDIAKNNSGHAIDIGDDMKAASSDALKKCASLFGISQDIFWPNGNEAEEAPQEEPTPEPSKPVEHTVSITESQKLEVITLLGKKGKKFSDLSTALEVFSVTSYQQLTATQAETLLIKMRSLPDKEKTV